MTTWLFPAAENGQTFRSAGRDSLRRALSGEGETGPRNEVSNAYENHERIPFAALLLVFQSDRTGCTLSQNASMAGFGLPQAGHSQGVSLLISRVTTEPMETPMADMIKMGTILIKDGTFLPESLRFESEPCTSGWRFVKNLDGYGLNRKIDEAGWTFFCLAGEIKATIFGFDVQKMVRRAVKRILANLKSKKFNSFEITRVASKRFLGLPYVTVSAHSRHIQESMFLFCPKELQERGPIKVGGRLNPIAMFPSPKNSLQEELIAQPGGRLFVNSKILKEMLQ